MKKKIVQINTTCGIGSTGKICVDISKLLTKNNIENYILYSNKTNGYELGIRCSSYKYTKLQSLKSRIFGNYGFNSRRETRYMIEHLERIKPDIVHLHNIHGHDCNLNILFEYLKKEKIKVIWTFHDCWAFTGYCTHFDMSGCDKWQYECNNCDQYRKYSWLLDRSKYLFKKKKELFKDLDLTIVTPSRWLANIVRESFLGEYPCYVINNGIDLDIFKPVESNFRETYNISKDKKILLGVAFDWSFAKGLDKFIDLSKNINNEEFQIVLVGTNEKIEKSLPNSIISIRRTNGQKELAEIYSACDLFLNFTREDNFPTVNIEAMACGTPILTFNTGGSPEAITKNTGVILDSKSLDEIINVINFIFVNLSFNKDKCISNAKKYEKNFKFQEYLKLYETR